MFTTPYSDIPKTVTMQNFTKQRQLMELGFSVPPATEDAKRNIIPGELVIDLSSLPAYRRERMWAACNNAHAGEVLKIK